MPLPLPPLSPPSLLLLPQLLPLMLLLPLRSLLLSMPLLRWPLPLPLLPPLLRFKRNRSQSHSDQTSPVHALPLQATVLRRMPNPKCTAHATESRPLPQRCADGSGSIGFDELFEFVRGRRHSLDERNKKVRTMRLEPPPNAPYTLEDVAWDEETLRLLLQKMLSRFGVGPSDLMRAWDKSGDGLLDRREFSREIQVWSCTLLWPTQIVTPSHQHSTARTLTYVLCHSKLWPAHVMCFSSRTLLPSPPALPGFLQGRLRRAVGEGGLACRGQGLHSHRLHE